MFEALRRCAPAEPEEPCGAGLRPANSGQGTVSSRGAIARFPKASKLLRHADFQRVYQQGRRHFAAHMTVFYLRRQDDSGTRPRVGFTVGRVLGGAVQRNRIKRRLREAVRHNLASLALAVDVVINPKKSALLAEFTVLNHEVARAFQVINEKESSRA